MIKLLAVLVFLWLVWGPSVPVRRAYWVLIPAAFVASYVWPLAGYLSPRYWKTRRAYATGDVQLYKQVDQHFDEGAYLLGRRNVKGRRYADQQGTR